MEIMYYMSTLNQISQNVPQAVTQKNNKLGGKMLNILRSNH